jgi:hypothetical protein
MKLIKVYTAAGELEGEMVKGFLEAQGIDVTLSQESVARSLGLTAGKLGEVKVLVPDSQVAEAQSFLAAMQAGDYEDTEYPADTNDDEKTDED